MPIEILVAIISGASAILGSFLGILSGQSLMKYRIEKLETEIETIANFGNRILTIELKLDEMHKDIIRLEKEVENE